MTWRGFALSSVFLLLSSFLGCGKKGPPLAPLNMAPEAPQSVAARRLGDTVFVQFTVPAKSAAGTGPFSVDHLDVYAVTIAPGAATPPNRDLLKPQFAVAKIPVRRPPDPDAPPAEGDETDKRPKPGDVIAFVEKLTTAALTPQASKPVVESSGAKKPAPRPLCLLLRRPHPPWQHPLRLRCCRAFTSSRVSPATEREAPRRFAPTSRCSTRPDPRVRRRPRTTRLPSRSRGNRPPPDPTKRQA